MICTGIEAARRGIVRFGRQLYDRFIFAGTDGNISVRLGENLILTTPTGVPKNELTESLLVLTDMRGRELSGGRASSEVKMHLAIYHARDDIGAIVHAHPSAATAFALSGESFGNALTETLVMFPGGVPVSPYCHAGSAELAEAAAENLKDAFALLLSCHGAVTVGEDLQSACERMDALENIAKTEIYARILSSHRRF